jgi:quercetin dioxygenase-like cupin family protein
MEGMEAMEQVSLTTLGSELLAEARGHSSGRASRTLHGGRDHALRQLVLALAADRSLSDHESPREATLQVLSGHVRLTTSDGDWDGHGGDFVVIPPVRHGLTAVTESVVLLSTDVTPVR